jgi:2-polyprenyl-3-methyl-5-hydroxy-6-metoxy-1,4-benzoquinol methylase
MADELTTRVHWENTWAVPPRWRLPSSLAVSTRNIQRVLRPHVRPGMHVLEVGCAPGKILAWVASALGANVAGLDYSERGIDWSRQLFEVLGLQADLRCEDVFETSFAPGTFDVVYSVGVIEHFDDPRRIVRTHVNLLKPGGKAVITVPNYAGIYGRIQHWFDAESLEWHNLEIMSLEPLARLAPDDLARDVRTYRAGKLNPWQITFERRWPRAVARAVCYAGNGIGLLQPFEIGPLAPILVLEMTRGGASGC